MLWDDDFTKYQRLWAKQTHCSREMGSLNKAINAVRTSLLPYAGDISVEIKEEFLAHKNKAMEELRAMSVIVGDLHEKYEKQTDELALLIRQHEEERTHAQKEKSSGTVSSPDADGD